MSVEVGKMVALEEWGNSSHQKSTSITQGNKNERKVKGKLALALNPRNDGITRNNLGSTVVALSRLPVEGLGARALGLSLLMQMNQTGRLWGMGRVSG